MNETCFSCGGACCLGLVIRPSPESFDWYSMHGEAEGDKVYLDCQCEHLILGVCSIYNDRPQVCKDYEVGGEACRNAVKRTGRKFEDLNGNS